MNERRLSCLGPSGFHRIGYREWPGPAGARTLVCVHGLTRNAGDFDAVADALSKHYRVVCPDMAGRGRSEWLTVPAEYGYPLYLADCAALIARLDVESVDWLGTSMGGLIGMMLAAQRGSPIGKLVINDIGPFVSKVGLERIRGYAGLDPTFPSLEALEAAVRANFATFGPLTDAEWRKMAQDSAREKPGGGWGFAYDPRIGDAIKEGPLEDVDMWPVWDKVRCPTLVLRGAVSDLLTRAAAEEMTRRGPKARLVEFAGIGHAPALLSEDQISAVRDFLLG
jgi:pimeloyl-ACP methyl ester carboxylesterase